MKMLFGFAVFFAVLWVGSQLLVWLGALLGFVDPIWLVPGVFVAMVVVMRKIAKKHL